ncbi:MAG: CapA family protein [Gallionellaceae bacterium]|nr:CapA family protein [Gallionellaceae bacterium]
MASLFACGDIFSRTRTDGLVCADGLAALVARADYSVCNFEAAIAGYGAPQAKVGPHLRQPANTIGGLRQQGFDLLLLANNHIMDFGPEALAATISQAESSGLDTLGAGLDAERAYRPLVKQINGLTLALINAGEAQFGVIDHFKRPDTAGYAWINHPSIDAAIRHMKETCDFVIVFSHAGLENHAIPQKEWRERYRRLCDLGADVVIGAHPHLPQGHERHGESLIFYSLGNFYFDWTLGSGHEDRSYAVWLELERGRPPSFRPVFHYTRDGLVDLAPDDRKIDLEALCGLLGEGYEEAHDRMCLEAYQSYRQRLLSALTPDSPLRRLKKALRRLLGSPAKKPDSAGQKTLMQLHLLRNEAYYHAARHALEIQAQRLPPPQDG